jgi:hypothetical protein
MMYRINADGDREPIKGFLLPMTALNVCQPPVNAIELIKQLDREELVDVVRLMTIYAPEALEKGLQRISEYRQIGMYL